MWPELLISLACYLGLTISDYLIHYFLGQATELWLKSKAGYGLVTTQSNNSIRDIYGIEALKAIIKDRRIQYNEIVNIFGSAEDVQFVLSEKRELTRKQIERLSHHFHVSPSVFFPREMNKLSYLL